MWLRPPLWCYDPTYWTNWRYGCIDCGFGLFDGNAFFTQVEPQRKLGHLNRPRPGQDSVYLLEIIVYSVAQVAEDPDAH